MSILASDFGSQINTLSKPIAEAALLGGPCKLKDEYIDKAPCNLTKALKTSFTFSLNDDGQPEYVAVVLDDAMVAKDLSTSINGDSRYKALKRMGWDLPTEAQCLHLNEATCDKMISNYLSWATALNRPELVPKIFDKPGFINNVRLSEFWLKNITFSRNSMEEQELRSHFTSESVAKTLWSNHYKDSKDFDMRFNKICVRRRILKLNGWTKWQQGTSYRQLSVVMIKKISKDFVQSVYIKSNT